MGPGPRFNVMLSTFFGLGFSLSRHPYAACIGIHLPFVAIFIGLGKPYTETN